MESEVKREIMLAHYQNPFHKETKDEGFIKANGNNVSCIDDINIFIKLNGDIIEDTYFDGEACAISTSSTSIMLTNIIGKTVEEAIALATHFEKMVNEETYNADLLGEALVYDEIYKQASRKTCATLPYVALRKALKEAQEGEQLKK